MGGSKAGETRRAARAQRHVRVRRQRRGKTWQPQRTREGEPVQPVAVHDGQPVPILVFGAPPSVAEPPLPSVNFLRSPYVFSTGRRYVRFFTGSGTGFFVLIPPLPAARILEATLRGQTDRRDPSCPCSRIVTTRRQGRRGRDRDDRRRRSRRARRASRSTVSGESPRRPARRRH